MSRERARERLLLEEVAKAMARVVGTYRAAGRVPLDGHHHRKERALVAGALVLDPLGDRLAALEAARGIEVRALAAGVELGLALRTARERVGGDRQHGPTRGAARRRAALEDPERPRRLRRLAAVLAAVGDAAASIALLPVLAVAHRLSLRAPELPGAVAGGLLARLDAGTSTIASSDPAMRPAARPRTGAS